MSSQTRAIQEWVDRLNSGDESARNELLKVASDRLLHLTRKIKRDFRGVARWEQTEDVYQGAVVRLLQALESVELNDARHFFRLAALQIRRQLLDLARSYYGPEGWGAHYLTQGILQGQAKDGERSGLAFDPAEMTRDPRAMEHWGEFHELIETLPDAEREVVDLLWYHGVSQADAAAVMETSVRSVKRHWRSARLILFEKLGDSIPET